MSRHSSISVSHGREHFPSARLAVVTRKKNEICDLLRKEDAPDIIVLTKLYGEYLDKVDNLIQAVQESEEKCSAAQKSDLSAWFEPHRISIMEFRSRMDKHLNKEREVRQSDSASSSSSIPAPSVRSNASSARVRLAERKAETAAEEEYVKKLKIIEEEKRRRERARKEDELRRNLEVEEENARFEFELRDAKVERKKMEQRILERELNELEGSACTSVTDLQSALSPNEELTPIVSPDHGAVASSNTFEAQLLTVMQKQNQISQSLARSQEKAALPRKEVQYFDGTDLTKFEGFIQSFKRVVENKCDDDADRLYYLEQYTKGAAHQLVKSCSYRDATKGYNAAMKLLQQEYGNEYVVAAAYLSKLEDWPAIKGEDAKALKEFSVFLMTCESYMDEISALNQLNGPKEIRNITLKLPFELRRRWRDTALNLNDSGKPITFKDLVSFVRRQSRILSQPLFGEIKDEISRSKADKSPRQVVSNRKVLATKSTTVGETCEGKKPVCEFCGKGHDLSSCSIFKEKPLSERRQFVLTGRLCFSCLKKGHTARGCSKRETCENCKGKHPTILHDDARRKAPNPEVDLAKSDLSASVENKSRISCSTHLGDEIDNGAGKKKISCAIVPVKVRVSGTSKIISTYAALDGCSTACFMSENLLENLEVPKVEATLALSTMGKQGYLNTKVVNNLELMDIGGNQQDVIPVVYAEKVWPFSRSDVPGKDDVAKQIHLSDVPFSYLDSSVDLLIGMNMPEMLKPLQIVDGPWNAPYASLHRLGWAICGPFTAEQSSEAMCSRIKHAKFKEIERQISDIFSNDFSDSSDSSLGTSAEDRRWLEKVENSVKLRSDGHYEVGLPFKDGHVPLPLNRKQVYGKFLNLKRGFEKKPDTFQDYNAFMETMKEAGFMKRVPEHELEAQPSSSWYLSHHGVYHKQKGKIRVVFDCSLKCEGIALNDVLYQGPDFINDLLGVLIRFREGKFALICDIKQMFYQVKVPERDTNFLRFFWFSDGRLTDPIVEFKLTVHVFGSISSPSVANFALLKTVRDNLTSDEARFAVERNFYVDDWLQSIDSVTTGKKLLDEVVSVVSRGGFELTQFISNSRDILSGINPSDLSRNLVAVDFLSDSLPCERALGVLWNIQKDSLGFKINIKTNPATRRGILSTIHSIYDPLGLSGPAMIPAKKIFQDTCRLKLEWNDELPEPQKAEWMKWLKNLPSLSSYEVPRWIHVDEAEHYELHYFADGSETAYGAIVFARNIRPDGSAVCSPLIAKARLTPLNNSTLSTIPRIELNAAKLAVCLHQILEREMTLSPAKVYFWTDSLTVLKYIWNDTARFQRFVSNRVAFIRSITDPAQWRYVPSELNPADHISRGISPEKMKELHDWNSGPSFLQQPEEFWPPQANQHSVVNEEDPEVKKCIAVKTLKEIEDCNPTEKLLSSTSDWSRLKCKVAWFLRFKNYLRGFRKSGDLTVAELGAAETEIWKIVQAATFPSVIDILKKKSQVPKSHNLSKLRPIMMDNLLRVGGRIRDSCYDINLKHPIILPNDHPAVKVFVRSLHVKLGHLGREMLVSHLRRKFWIVGLHTLVRRLLRECVICRRLQGKLGEQLMSDLPSERVVGDHPPFTNVGIDYFGPFIVTKGRRTEKRYGVIFTCLSSRAIHIEVAFSLNTDSFINAFRRFVSRRGNVKTIRSDNGTNFTSGNKEMAEEIKNWNESVVKNWMKQRSIEWKFQPPSASHFGGVWEREIRTIRKTLNALMKEQPVRLNDEELNTLFCEVEAILNSRPLTELTNDPSDLEALTPNHLLLLHSGVTFPPGLFSRDDLYAKRRWKQVQYLANLFWVRWRKQYLPLLQERQKWTRSSRSLQPNDLVLVVDQLLPRSLWSTGRVTQVYPDNEGNVRSAKVKIAKYKDAKNTNFKTIEIERPIVKLILLCEARDV